MAYWKRGLLAILFVSLVQTARADVSPLSFTYFGLYGSPVQPTSLAISTSDAFGMEGLLEAKLTNYFSLGISYEQTTFFSSPAFWTEMGNLEVRLFPFLNEKDPMSPYIYGGAGLNFLSGAPYQLKAGLGSRVAFAGPFFIDVAAGSHWVQNPGAFQYVDVRAGLSISFDYKEEQSNSSSSTTTTVTHTNNVNNVTNTNANNNANANNNGGANQTAATTNTTAPATPVVQTQVSPVTQVVQVNVMVVAPTPTATVISLDLAEPTIAPTPLAILAEPVTTLAQGKRFYKLGMDAFMAADYRMSLKFLKKSLELREIHNHAYYYAETYATIGVIYQFHAPKVKDHLQKALSNYKTALIIDPTTKSAKRYYKPLKRRLAAAAKTSKKKSRHKAKPKPTPNDSSTTPQDSSSPSGTGTPVVNFN